MLDWLFSLNQDTVRRPGAERITLADHVRIFERIAGGDPDGAAKAVTHHLLRTSEAGSSNGDARGSSGDARGSSGDARASNGDGRGSNGDGRGRAAPRRPRRG
jgi:hypothetical protein